MRPTTMNTVIGAIFTSQTSAQLMWENITVSTRTPVHSMTTKKKLMIIASKITEPLQSTCLSKFMIHIFNDVVSLKITYFLYL